MFALVMGIISIFALLVSLLIGLGMYNNSVNKQHTPQSVIVTWMIACGVWWGSFLIFLMEMACMIKVV